MLTLIVAAVAAVGVAAQAPPRSTPSAAPTPKLTSSIVPVFPQAALSQRDEGIVIARLTVAPDGRVADVMILRTVPLLDAPVRDALRQWTFAPAGVEVSVQANVRFILSPVPVSHDPPTTAAVSWPPPDFAVYYSYECASGTAVTIDSLQGVTQTPNGTSPLALSAEDKERLSSELVQAGFFASPDSTTEREARATLRQAEDSIEVVVSGHAPLRTATTWDESGEQRRNHQLMARTYGVWRVLRWNEPVARDDQQGRESVRIGETVRDFIRPRVQDRSVREALS